MLSKILDVIAVTISAMAAAAVIGFVGLAGFLLVQKAPALVLIALLVVLLVWAFVRTMKVFGQHP